MLEFINPGVPVNGRTFVVPLMEATCLPSITTVPVCAQFQLRQRDSLDFSMDFSAWLAANGQPNLASAVWSIPATSPQTPILGVSGFSPAGHTAVVVTPALLAAVGDVYWLDVAATTTAVTIDCVPGVVVPSRGLTRRIAIVVVAG